VAEQATTADHDASDARYHGCDGNDDQHRDSRDDSRAMLRIWERTSREGSPADVSHSGSVADQG